jgi:hypothetical protein
LEKGRADLLISNPVNNALSIGAAFTMITYLSPADNSFNGALQPFYIALEDDGPRFGLYVTQQTS